MWRLEEYGEFVGLDKHSGAIRSSLGSFLIQLVLRDMERGGSQLKHRYFDSGWGKLRAFVSG